MMMHDQKKAVMTIMKKRSSKGEHIAGPTPMRAENVKTSDMEPDGRHFAAQDMISAFHEKSAANLMTALSNFIDLHGMKPGSSAPESEE